MTSTPEPSMDWTPRRVSITADGPTARVLLDDTEISRDIRGYSLEHRPGEYPMVVLYTRPGTEAAFEGMAMVAVGQQADPGEAIAAFLQNIDPAALQRAALNRNDLDGTPSELTTAMLRQLADWAQGKR